MAVGEKNELMRRLDALEGTMCRALAAGEKKDSAASKEMIELRKQVIEQGYEVMGMADVLLSAAGPELSNEWMRRLRIQREIAANHLMEWPISRVVTNHRSFAASSRELLQVSLDLLRWLRGAVAPRG